MEYWNSFDNQIYFVKNNEKKNIATIGKMCGISVVMFIILSTIFSFIILRNSKLINLYENNDVFSSSISAIMAITTLFLPFYFAYSSLKKKNLATELPFGKPYDKKDFLLLIPIAMMICIIGSIFTGLLSSLMDSWFGIEFTQPDDTSDYSTVGGILMAEIATAVVPALIEEFAIRGMVMQSLRRYGDKFAIIMSSFVFALMHGNMIQIPFAFIAGIALGYVAIKTGSLWTGIIVHFINNSVAVLSLVIDNNCTEQQYSIFAAALYAVVFIIGGICLYFYLKKDKNVFSCLLPQQNVYLRTGEKISSFICNVPMILAIAVLVGETALYINS